MMWSHAGWCGGGGGALSGAMGAAIHENWFWFQGRTWTGLDAQAGDAEGSILVFHFKVAAETFVFSVI